MFYVSHGTFKRGSQKCHVLPLAGLLDRVKLFVASVFSNSLDNVSKNKLMDLLADLKCDNCVVDIQYNGFRNVATLCLLHLQVALT